MNFLKNKNLKIFLGVFLAFILCAVFVYFIFPKNIHYKKDTIEENKISSISLGESKDSSEIEIKDIEEKANEILEINLPNNLRKEEVVHIKTPESVKAVYVSSWVAGSPSFINSIIKMIEETELNAIVIDIKDSTGRVAFNIEDPYIKNLGSIERRIGNIDSLIKNLHDRDIYIIGRISVFQDPYLSKVKPEWSITRLSDGGVWKDKKGLSFLDPTRKEVLDYNISIALHSYKMGFDEINFDYIRYPSDGNMKDINYNLKEGETRSDNIEKFFKYLNQEMKKNEDIPISADLFGLTTEVLDDMGIGQIWEKALPYFDFISPMVYPSHYPSLYMGYKNPSLYPYEVINRALSSAVTRTENKGYEVSKIRPWLQDFDLGANYDKDMVRAQIKATYDNGIDSWMLWDPKNKYTKDALIKNSD